VSPSPIVVEPLAWRDGAPFSQRYGDVYASRDGALAQAQQVFLAGCGLQQRWRGRDQFVVLETGFGLGINFLATWQAWRNDPQRPRRLHVVSVEAHPVSADSLRAAAPPPLADLAALLASQWPQPVRGLHRLRFDDGAVTLTLALGEADALMPQLALGADALYLDGFAPACNPQMWSAPLLRALARLARPGATLATWCTARAVRDALAAAGFDLALRSGFGRKRERLEGRYAPRYVVRRHEPPAAYAGERRAIVIGAGLAGCSVSHALAARGWQVHLIERAHRVAAGASALPAGLMHPQPATDDSRLARLTRAAAREMEALLPVLDPAGHIAGPGGMFHQAADADELERWRAMLAAADGGHGPVELLDRDAAAARLGLLPARGGLWFAQGRAIACAAWCEALCAAAGPALHLHLGHEVTRVARDAAGWRVDALGQHGSGAGRSLTLAAPVIVHAAALVSPVLAALTSARLRAVRGRLSLLADADLAALRAPITGAGYALRAPPAVGGALIGASYETALPGADPASADGGDEATIHAGNVARLGRLLPAAPLVQLRTMFDQWRAVSDDRLPLAGALPDEAAMVAGRDRLAGAHLPDLPRLPGAWGVFGLGSRGLTLAALMAELVAAQIEGEPWPIERDLAASVDPARFVLARLRHGRVR